MSSLNGLPKLQTLMVNSRASQQRAFELCSVLECMPHSFLCIIGHVELLLCVSRVSW